MLAPLNFGPSEQSRAQRQLIADRALAITLEEEPQALADLLVLYERYVDGQVDLYAISIHVGERTRQRLLQLIKPQTATV